jgi:hypothetical protein
MIVAHGSLPNQVTMVRQVLVGLGHLLKSAVHAYHRPLDRAGRSWPSSGGTCLLRRRYGLVHADCD